MKTYCPLLLLCSLFVLFTSCKKDASNPAFFFPGNVYEGQSKNGSYTIVGSLQCQANLRKVTLQREDEPQPFIVDELEERSKQSYEFSYQVTGIIQDTYIALDAFDQNGGKSRAMFLVKK